MLMWPGFYNVGPDTRGPNNYAHPSHAAAKQLDVSIVQRQKVRRLLFTSVSDAIHGCGGELRVFDDYCVGLFWASVSAIHIHHSFRRPDLHIRRIWLVDAGRRTPACLIAVSGPHVDYQPLVAVMNWEVAPWICNLSSASSPWGMFSLMLCLKS